MKKVIAGNWKMYSSQASAVALAKAMVDAAGNDDRVTVVLCPPFPYLTKVAEVLAGSKVKLGAQNAYLEKEGAFTGEVAPPMLVDVGCQYVILGHSERRHKLGESNEVIARKLRAALDAGLHVILCIGETLDERQSGQTLDVLKTQLAACLPVVKAGEAARLVIAYEPVWAIGTNVIATNEQIVEAHGFVRELARQHLGEEAASALPIQYGGSVSASNAAEILKLRDVDGVLVGRASLDAAGFRTIIQAGI